VFRRRPRAALEIGIVVLAGALVAGAVFGSGLAQTVLDTPDPLTWLRNNRGEVAQVNPEAGAMVDRLRIGDNGDPLQVVQGDGVLVVTNLRTNEVTIVDLSLMRTVQVLEGGPAGVKVLLTNGQLYLAYKDDGRIERLDPLTAETLGEWRADGPLADAAVDAAGSLWALNRTGRLVSLRWPDDGQGFAEQDRRDLAGTGAEAVLVAHQRGATAVDPGGSATQVGTGQDRTLRADGLAAPLAAADLSPAGLVPVSSPESRRVHLVRDDGVVAVDGAPLGCRKPGKPAVYRGMVYTPCIGDRKVIVLDPDGRRAGPDLATPAGGEPELVLNAGLLIVNVPGAPTGLVVKPDGSTLPLRTDDPRVEVRDPNSRPTALPSGLGIRPPKQPQPPDRRPGQNPDRPPASRKPGGQPGTSPGQDPTSGAPGGQDPGDIPGSPSPGPGEDGETPTPGPTLSLPVEPTTEAPVTEAPTTQPPREEDLTPSGATAEARPDGTVRVAWVPPVITPDSYRILRVDTGADVGVEVTTAPAGAAETFVSTGLTLGVSVSFVVEAVYADGSYQSDLSNPVTAFGRPAGPNVAVELAARSPASITLRVFVDVVSDGGSPVTSYDLSANTGSGRVHNAAGVPIGQRPYQFAVECGGTGDVCLSGGTVVATATLINGAGAGPPNSTTVNIPPPQQFGIDTDVMFVSSGGKCFDVDLRLHTCTGSPGQFWSVRATGEIRNRANNQCLSSPDGLHFSTNCNAPPDDQRWTVHGGGNLRVFQNQDTDRCLVVNGDPARENVQVLDLGCRFNSSDTWYLFTRSLPLTAARPASFTPPAERGRPDGPLGTTVVALLLLPLSAGLLRRRHRRRPPS
jgi:hypothetical protein